MRKEQKDIGHMIQSHEIFTSLEMLFSGRMTHGIGKIPKKRNPGNLNYPFFF